MSSFKNKTVKAVTGVIVGLIVISFVFTLGYNDQMGTISHVAQVGNSKISFSDFEREVAQQVRFYSQITGGQELTSDQIEQFQIRYAALRNLINQRLLNESAESFGVYVGDASVSDEIKKLPYFQTNNQFDLLKYKQLLEANRLSSASFEAQVRDGVAAQTVQQVLASFPISETYIKDLSKFKNDKIKVTAVEFSSEDFVDYVEVTPAEIVDYLSNPVTQEKVRIEFEKQKGELSTPEQVKASHILLTANDKETDEQVLKKAQELKKKLTVKNFATLANKNTMDPSGKGKGGDLGWFSKGRMVPGFENAAFSLKPGTISEPIKTAFGYHIIYVQDKKAAVEATLDANKERIAKKMIQEGAKDKIEEMMNKAFDQFKAASTDMKKIDRLLESYNLEAAKEREINRLEGRAGAITFTSEQVAKIFSANSGEAVDFIVPEGKKLVIVHGKTGESDQSDEDTNKELAGQRVAFANQLRNEVMEKLWSDHTVKCLGDKLETQNDLFRCKLQ